MPISIYDILILPLTFILSAWIVWVLIHNAGRLHLIDFPNGRSSHSVPTPRCGGIAVVLMYYFGVFLITLRFDISTSGIVALFGSGTLVAVIGFWDDRRGLSAKWRILMHLAAAVWALVWLGGFPATALGLDASLGWLSSLLAVIGLVWLINLYNFMDGIDGIAGTEALFVTGSAALLCFMKGDYVSASIAATLMSAVAGFQVWNFSPARIFLGDVGSGFLGLMLGLLAILTVVNGSIPFWSWIILLGVFVVDTMVTLIRRITRGDRWYEAHCSHAYQHMARRVKSHGRVVASVAVINVFWLLPFAVAVWRWPSYGFFLMIGALTPIIFLAIYLNAGSHPVKHTQ